MNDHPIILTPDQEKTVEALIAQGWKRAEAVLMVLESEPDVIGEPQ
jgi:translation initiation factor 2B subunit (eIF-2B alpha/beta/delta family)